METADSHLDPKLVTKVGDQAGSLWGQKRAVVGERRGPRCARSFKAIPEDRSKEPQLRRKHLSTPAPPKVTVGQGPLSYGEEVFIPLTLALVLVLLTPLRI